jgi:hypothetical protein
MKKIILPFAVLQLTASLLLAGNWFGAGPWANGAYYPGQYDGVYSATVFGGTPTVVSGVLGFGLRNGSPTTSTNSTVSTNGTQNTITVDPFQNYFVLFIGGRTFAGVTVASLNNNSDQVSGGLFNGVAPSTLSTFVSETKIETTFNTNTPPGLATSNNITNFTTLSVENSCGGAFNATLTGKKAVITFSGNNTGTVSTSFNGVPVSTNTFSLNGLKVGNQASQASTTTAGGL